jgi:hypothetical protein
VAKKDIENELSREKNMYNSVDIYFELLNAGFVNEEDYEGIVALLDRIFLYQED